MEYKKIVMDMMYLVTFNIFFSLHGAAHQTLPLLVSHKNNTYQSVLISQKNTKLKKIIDDSQSFCLPEEIQQTIHKLAKFCYWKDEINSLKSISPVIIGNQKLWAIDLWKLCPEDRKSALCYHGKATFDQEEREALNRIVPQEMKQDLVIHRLPLNDEIYQDWGPIPGGIMHLRLLASPILGLITTVVGGATICIFAHSYLNCGQSFAISGGVGAGITVVGWGAEYWRHRWMLTHNPVAMTLNDV